MIKTLALASFTGLFGLLMFVFLALPFTRADKDDSILGVIDVSMALLATNLDGSHSYELTNNGLTSVFYQTEVADLPFYEIQLKTEYGYWKDVPNTFICGISGEFRVVRPNESITFNTTSNEAQFRAGVRVMTSRGWSGSTALIWPVTE